MKILKRIIFLLLLGGSFYLGWFLNDNLNLNKNLFVQSEELSKNNNFSYDLTDGYVLKEEHNGIDYDIKLPTITTNKEELEDLVINFVTKIIEEMQLLDKEQEEDVTSLRVWYEFEKLNELSIIKLYYEKMYTEKSTSKYESIVFDKNGKTFNSNEILQYYNLNLEDINNAVKTYDSNLVIDSYYINGVNELTINVINKDNLIEYVNFPIIDGKIVTSIP